MRRDGRRKASKRKSFEAEKPNCSRSNSANESFSRKADDEEICVAKDLSPIAIKEEDIKDIEVENQSEELVTEVPEAVEDSDEDKDGQAETTNILEEVTEAKETSLKTEKTLPDNNSDEINQNGTDGEKRPEVRNEIVLEEDNKHEKLLSKATSEAALRLYSSLNQIAMQAMMSVKQEPLGDSTLPEKYMQSFLASLNGRYFDDDDTLPEFPPSLSANDASFPPPMLRPPAEMSPNTFAKQLRCNDLASMVVCRGNKSLFGSQDSGSSGALKNSASGQGGGSSGLHQFVTRYTIERSDDPSRSGIEICLAGDDPHDPIIEVECGGNKGLLYVTKLCQGSKGQSILFNDEWLTPNEFQFISGRETAKDWKRSIRHCGKSLKTLMTKGILMVHPPVCECDYCKGQGPATLEKMKKRSYGPSHDRHMSSQDTIRSGGSTTPSSTESTTPLSNGVADPSSISLHKPGIGREGGLSSIISQLHNKKANSGNDVMTGSREESLDLSMARTTSSASPSAINGRKRQRESGQNFSIGQSNGIVADQDTPMKRRHSNEDGHLPLLKPELSQSFNSHRKSPKSSIGSLSLSTNQQLADQKQRNLFSSSPQTDGRSSSQDTNGAFDLTQENRKSYPNESTPPSSANGAYSDFYKASRYSEQALMEAMKRVVAHAYSDQVRNQTSPPSRHMSASPSVGRGFINLASTRRFDRSPNSIPPKDQPMVELTSHRKMNGGRFYEHPDYDRRRNIFESNNRESHKAPLTVLHPHHNQFENPLPNNYRHPNPFFSGMPPPFNHHRYGPKAFGDRYRYGGSPALSRVDRKTPKGRNNFRRMVSGDNARRGYPDAGTPMVDLDKHAIPMLSLNYSNKKKGNLGEKEKSADKACSVNSKLSGRSRSALDVESKSKIESRKAASDDELSRKNDHLRRQSSSAPPPQFSDSLIDGNVDENNNEKGKDLKDEVFDHPRAKSASPNAGRMHPYMGRSRGHPRSSSSVDGARPNSNFSCFQDSIVGASTMMQQYEMLRWRELSSAIEDMGLWKVDDVCKFLSNIGCEQYQEAFRENEIDGDALPLLMEHHLVNRMGLKLGHALKVIARVQRRLGNHCALVMDRIGPAQPPFRPQLFPMTTSFSGTSDISANLGGSNESSPPLEKDLTDE